MRNKHFDWSMFIGTLIAGVIAAALSTFILFPKLGGLETWFQTAIYLAATALLMVIAVWISLFAFNGKVKSKSKSPKDKNRTFEVGFLKDYNSRYKRTAVSIGLLFVLISAILGGGFEAIYNAIGNAESKTTFGGSYIVADFSGSMNDNDSAGEMKKSIVDYIRGVPLNTERFGITIYNSTPEIIPAKPADMNDADYNEAVRFFKEYTAFTSDAQKENVIKLVESSYYQGETYTGGALLTALGRMVSAVSQETQNVYSNNRDSQHYPGLVMLYSDGLTSDPISYSEILTLSTGYGNERLIPVNTIYFKGGDPAGESYMREISRITGGNFNYTGGDSTGYTDIFKNSYEGFNIPTPNLLFTARGPLAESAGRAVLQFLFIYIWIVASAFAVYLILGNKKLFKNFFLVKLLWAFITAVAACLLIQFGGAVGLIVGQVIVTMSFAAAVPVYHYELSK
jgi:hypothetical protein